MPKARNPVTVINAIIDQIPIDPQFHTSEDELRLHLEALREHYQPMLSPKGWMGDWQTEFKRYNKEQA